MMETVESVLTKSGLDIKLDIFIFKKIFFPMVISEAKVFFIRFFDLVVVSLKKCESFVEVLFNYKNVDICPRLVKIVIRINGQPS